MMLGDSPGSQHPIFLPSALSARWTGGQRCPQAKRVPSVPGKRQGMRRSPVLSAPCCWRRAGAGGRGGASLAEVAAPSEEGGCWAVSPPGPLPLDVTLRPPRRRTGARPWVCSRTVLRSMELELPGHGSGAMLRSHGCLIPPYPPVLLLRFEHRSSVLPSPWAVGETASTHAGQPSPPLPAPGAQTY